MLQKEIQISREAYLRLESQDNQKREFFAGQVFLMAGGTFKHAKVSGNVFALLRQSLSKKSCFPMNSDMRINTPSGLDTYPDVSVYCGEPELNDNETTLLNPVMVVEVLSPSTREYDRSSKFMHYRSIAGLQDYLLIDPASILVEHYHRMKPDEWLLRVYSDLADVIQLTKLGVEISLAGIYE